MSDTSMSDLGTAVTLPPRDLADVVSVMVVPPALFPVRVTLDPAKRELQPTIRRLNGMRP